uniref:TYR_PHOSPHATASE_2 domain-containing protein n=1 Tax=Syphacia muris TaxID=451379 RepID=A0A0N5AIA5_9BILA
MGRISRVVPKQWVNYNPIGNVIKGTRFLVFKTPINSRLATKIAKEQRFNISDLFRTVAERGLSFGLIIDLTDTDRYYDKGDVEGMCIPYEKINCPGRSFAERDDLVESFGVVVDSFLEANLDNDLIIGVHCTNGINRSGYLICRYLIDRLGWTSHEAIDAFEKARGYPIERGSYIRAIHRAAKERKTKKRYKHSDDMISSDDETQRQSKKRKHKKKKRSDFGSGDESVTPDQMSVEAAWTQLSLAFEQHKAVTESLTNNHSVASASPLDYQQTSQGSSHASAEESPYVGSNDGIEAEDSAENINGTSEQIPVKSEVSRSRKRKERRQRLQKEYGIMRTGNFWKINEMQKEKFGAI